MLSVSCFDAPVDESLSILSGRSPVNRDIDRMFEAPLMMSAYCT